MPLVLTLRADPAGPAAIDLVGILPHAVAGRPLTEIGRIVVRADARPCELGLLFDITGDTSDSRIECHGDFSRVHHVGSGMESGRIDVAGDVGRHAAERMSGGTLHVAGSAGDWLAAELSGGEVVVAGSAGDNAAGALAGSELGMRGGLVIVGGTTGCLAGARMRRGVLAVGGDCGEAAAFEMRAGTVVIGGNVGRRSGMGMRRGSLIALAVCPELSPNFRRGAAWRPAFLPLLLRRLRHAGFRPATTIGPRPSQPWHGPWQQWHGDGLAGGRGEIFHPASGLGG